MKIWSYLGLKPFKIFIVCLIAMGSSYSLSSELRPFDAEYVAYRSGNDIGSAYLQLSSVKSEINESQSVSSSSISSANTYTLTYQSKVKKFFLSDKRYEKTYFLDKANQLIPISYEYKRTGTGPDKSLKVEFNSQNQKIIIDNGEELDWQGEFDNQLFRIDLPTKLAEGETKTSYDFINYRGEKRHYELELVTTENISLPYGQLMAMKVKINRESSSRVTYAWFAPSLNHNLVRLQQFKDGKEQGDMQLSKFSYL